MQPKLDQGICNFCGLSWPCQAAVKRHLKAHKNGKDDITPNYVTLEDVEDEFASDLEDENITEEDPDEAMPIISDIKTFLKPPFEVLYE